MILRRSIAAGVALWTLVCRPILILAEETGEVHSLEDIVVTGTRTPYRADEAPVPTHVIRREEIMATSSDNIADVQRYRLRLAPGTVVEPESRLTLRPRGGLPMTIDAVRTNSASPELPGRTARLAT